MRKEMIDLHTHTIFSDGELVPAELVRRYEVAGCAALGITDHADSSNLDFVVPRIVRVARDLNGLQAVKVVPGVELTHVPPSMIGPLVNEARRLGAALVVVHGETIVEPVPPGTNRAAIEAGADILAHPGLVSEEEMRLAAEKGVFLEVSARKGHCLSNGHVVLLAGKTGARLLLNSDAHGPADLLTEPFARRVAEGAGLPPDSLQMLLSNSRLLLQKIGYPD